MRPDKKNDGPGVVDLIEEAVHLLRQHPQELVGYYLGTGPFAVVLLYFWAYVTWFRPPDGAVAAGALFLAVLFGGMKVGQHRFASRLLASRLGEEPPSWTWRNWLDETAVQFRLHAAGVVLVPLAALFAVPFGWIYAYYQSATVLPSEKPGDSVARRYQAWEQMQLWPQQNHWALTILTALWMIVFLNLAVAFYAVPLLATRWLGLKTVFALSGWSYLNTTFLALVAVLTHLLVDPLIKAFYLLRIFHGRSRHTGADLRLVVRREKKLKSGLAAGLLLVAGMLASPPPAQASEPTPVVAAGQTAPAPLLDQALDRVLVQPEFSWRLHPLPVLQVEGKEGIIAGFVRSSFAVIAQISRTVVHWIEQAYQWLADLFPGGKEKKDEDAAKAGERNPLGWMTVLQLTSILLLLAVVGLLLFVAWKVWQHNRITVPLVGQPLAEAPGNPDLTDENVQASQLPAAGWLNLARRQMAAGEWRLALRALFLAALAQYAHEGLVSLAKFKTNLDYEAELRRRAHSRIGLVEEFRLRRRQFEEVWYGAEPASDGLVRAWLQQLEGRT